VSSDQVVLERMFRGMSEFYARCSGPSPGGRAVRLGGVRAAVMPALPHASIVNCVSYGDAEELEDRLDEVGDLYEDAGVRAWSVWTHESDERARGVLRDAGFLLDSEPMSMALELDGFEPGTAAVDWTAEPDPPEIGIVVDASYSFPAGTYSRGVPEIPPNVRVYLARHEEQPAAVVLASDLEGDCGIYLVGTIPEARGRGLSTALMRQALSDAAARGCTISTLQASEMGHPVYRRLGYRDLGHAELWERRAGS
jgi:GNAT superfamily N-acetyltransferase